LIIFDEKEYAERLLVEGYIRKEKVRKDLFVLYKYYKHLGYSQLQTAKILFRFVKVHNNFVYEDLETRLKWSIINGIHKVWKYNYTFRADLQIKLSKNELETIKAQQTNGEKQILFAMCVLNKVFKNKSNKFYASIKDMCGLTGLYYDEKHMRNIIDKIINNGYINISQKLYIFKNKAGKLIFYKKTYYHYNIKEDGDIVYQINSITNTKTFVKDFSQAMKKVDKELKYCKVCGEEFVPKSNAHRMCKQCWNKLRKKQIKIINKRYYKKLRSNRKTPKLP
jgi:hypothetical protein